VRSEDAIRVFFAVDLDDAARGAAGEVVRALAERRGGDGVRWVRPEALHVTLRFLGDIEPARVAPLVERVGRAVAPLVPFELALGAPGLFPGGRRPRVVAFEVEPADRLEALAAAVERGVVEAGFDPEERPFRAHLTLGRLRGRRPPSLRGVAPPEGVCFPVTEAVLFRSELSPSGATYTPLGQAELGRGEVSEENHP